MLPVKKVYIDSLYKSKGTTENFSIDLKENLELPNNTVCYISDILLSHSWFTVESGVNDRLYVQMTSTEIDPNLKPNECRIVVLTPQNYNGTTLATELQTQINNAFSTQSIPTHVSVSYNTQTNLITITPATSTIVMKVLTDYDLINGLPATIGGWVSAWNGASYDPNNLKSINSMINNYDSPSSFKTNQVPFISSYVDLQYNKYIFLCSDTLTSYSTLGSRGEKYIIKKIPITSNNNELVVDSISSEADYLDVSKMNLSNLNFSVRNQRGDFVNLHNTNISFCLIFAKYRDIVNE